MTNMIMVASRVILGRSLGKIHQHSYKSRRKKKRTVQWNFSKRCFLICPEKQDGLIARKRRGSVEEKEEEEDYNEM